MRVDLEALFTNAWSHWPKKVERKDALAKFKVASKKHDPDQLAAVIAKFGDAYAATTEPQYVPALGVWIGRERWDDTLPQARTVQRAPTRGEENLAFLVELASEESGRRREITDGQD
ncbi:hypothetical protein ASC66_01150 [Leifsonia sp. Root4]|nr:hypothetical protein ASC66_01150 [Leifsonia sp. Root4]